MSFFLFPGQGSQKAGMGQDFYAESPAAKAILDEANALFDGDLLSTLFEDPEGNLNHTRFAQPGLLAVEVAIARHLIDQGVTPTGCAGHSLGEIPALVVSGALAFTDAFTFTLERARLMSENVPEGGMAAVMGLEADAIASNLPEGVQVANFNGPGQTIISGSVAGIEAAVTSLKEAGAKRVMPLKVSGPFHSEFMRPAAESLANVLADMPIGAPATPFISSVTAGPVSDPETIRTLLAEQLYSPVQWTKVMAAAADSPAIEVGPGNVLKGLAKRADHAPEVECVGTVAQAQALCEAPAN
jgi:[acyl-carrier-protein] S-malonyltransferase